MSPLFDLGTTTKPKDPDSQGSLPRRRDGFRIMVMLEEGETEEFDFEDPAVLSLKAMLLLNDLVATDGNVRLFKVFRMGERDEPTRSDIRPTDDSV